MKIQELALELKTYTSQVGEHLQYKELLSNLPHMKGRTVFDTLTSLTDLTLSEYPSLLQAKKHLKKLYSASLKEFETESLEDIIVNLDLSISDADNSINEIFLDLDEEKTDEYIHALTTVISMFPEKYKQPVGKVNFVVEDDLVPYVSFNETQKDIKSPFSDDSLLMASLIAHEFTHLLENANSELRKISHDFLTKRRYSDQMASLSEFSEDHGIDYMPEASDVKVIPGAFIDPYVGRIYQKEENYSQDENTEVLSVGVQALILNPVNFLFKDPEHFLITCNLLKGLY